MNVNINKLFGNKLIEIRTELKITQEELGLKCNIQPSQMGKLERGEQSPTLDTIYKIAKSLEISPSELIDFKNKLEIPHVFDEETNKIFLRIQNLDKKEKSRILGSVKALTKK